MKITSIAFPMMLLATGFLTTGCSAPTPTPPPVVTEPFFCDVYEPRRFTQDEIDWRSANAPWNLRRDFANNRAHDRECLTTGDKTGRESAE